MDEIKPDKTNKVKEMPQQKKAEEIKDHDEKHCCKYIISVKSYHLSGFGFLIGCYCSESLHNMIEATLEFCLTHHILIKTQVSLCGSLQNILLDWAIL